MAAERVVIGMTGAVGSGSTTAAKHLRDKYDLAYVRLSKPLEHIWKSAHPTEEPPRAAMQRLGDKLRKRTHRGILADLALKDVAADLTKSIVVDGIRNVGEIEALRERFGYHFTLIAVVSTFDARWERIGDKYTDRNLTFDDFRDDDERDRNEETPHGQQVELCVDKADILIENSDGVTLRKYKKKISEYYELVTGIKIRPANDQEILMNMALSASHSSKCKKRHVGAVIVNVRGQIVGVGFNENPIPTKPCVDEEEYDFHCFKDAVRDSHLKDLAARGVRCPKCGSPLPTDGPPWRCPGCRANKQKTNLETFFFPDRAMTWCTAIHAEMNAIFAAGERARGGTLYTTTFPCFQCAEKITQAGIKTVYFSEAYPDPHSGRRLELSNIELRQFEGVRSSSFERIFSRNRPN